MTTPACRLCIVVSAWVVLAACGRDAPPPKPGAGLVEVIAKEPAAPKTSAEPPKAPPPRADATLLPRSVLFSNPDRATPLLSPDGKRVSYLAAVGGVLNVWVADVGDLANALPVTNEKTRGIRFYRWAYDSEHVLYSQDQGGDENWHVHAVDLKTGKDTDITPYAGAQARIERTSHRRPHEILVGINDRDKRYHDLYRVDILTGARTLVLQNDGYSRIDADEDFKVRFITRPEKDGSLTIFGPDKKPSFTIPLEDTLTTRLAGFDKTATHAFIIDSRDRDKAALYELDLATRKKKLLLEDARADIDDVFLHPTENRVQAAVAIAERMKWQFVDKSFEAAFASLSKKLAGEDVSIVSRTLDDSRWLVSTIASDAPVKTYLFDRKKQTFEFLFSNIKALENASLAKMEPEIIEARDGLELVSYLTLPRGAKGPMPMVLLVHGGPWARDEYGLNRTHQWLASRGYAVLSVNYRGSTGFGKRFLNAANHEWAGKMHDDLLDAVAWAVARKIARPDRVAIMGGSYGGYATLVGLTFTPETFACGVDIVGPSNLTTLLQSIPPYWETEVETFTKRIGDHRTEEGRKKLFERSPLSRVDRIVRPLLIGQGMNDPRVKQAESDQIVHALQAKRIPVTYVLYPDEGHGFQRPENRTSFNAVAEIFLAQCLGGPYEPIGHDFAGSSITVPAGAENIHSLREKL